MKQSSDGTKAPGRSSFARAAIAAKIGCSGETLRNWVRQAERDAGVRPGATTDEPAMAA